jgi:predicted transcriptional regulator
MKALKIKQLAEKDEEIADILISLGMSRNMAMSLAYLQNMNSATSIDLERVVRLRQPEVSITMKQLEERGWINEREEKMPGKGRPFKIYSLKVGFKEIIAQLEKQQQRAADEAKANVERLKELGK